eukprot:245134-Amphidinium_carterae.1
MRSRARGTCDDKKNKHVPRNPFPLTSLNLGSSWSTNVRTSRGDPENKAHLKKAYDLKKSKAE